RTSFRVVDGEPVQVISPTFEAMLPVIDLREIAEDERESEAQRLIAQSAMTAFDLSQGPLLRVSLLRLGEEEHIVVVTMHHIISDGWSMGVFIKELATLYEAFTSDQPSPLPELIIQYVDYAVWQREWLQGDALERELGYWRKQLEGAPSVIELPTDHPRPAIQSFRGGQQSISLPESIAEPLRALSQRQGVTLFMTLLAAFQSLLARYSGQDEIVVGTPIAGRTRAEVEPLIGFFVNTLVLRTRVDGEKSFRELLREVREVCLGAYAHQELPFEKLVEELQPQRDLSRTPLFQVMLVLQNAPQQRLELSGLTLSTMDVETGTAKFDLVLSLTEQDGGLQASWRYRRELFEEQSIGRMMGHFERVLEGVVADPEQRLWELPLLTEAERHQLLVEWNDTGDEFPSDLCLHHLIEAQVEGAPDAVAVVYEDEQLSYGELNARANQLAHYLRSLGVGRESLVGILLERSVEMVVALLGTLKAGAAYVPLDPQYPQERLQWMVEDASVGVLLTEQRLRERIPAQPMPVVCLDVEWASIARRSDENPSWTATADNLAYVIYTSGSTGRPKGAMNTHRAICNRLLWMQQTYQLGPSEAVLQKTPFSFDVSVWEFFWPLLAGARLVMARPGGHYDSAYLVEIICAQQITTLHFVPPMLRLFLEQEGVGRCRSLRRVIASGQALSSHLAARCAERLEWAALHNLYGPTEAAVDVTAWSYQPGGPEGLSGGVPIGVPISNTRVYVLDAKLGLVAAGVAGELYLGGVCVGRGYLKRPGLTAERFIPDPYSVEAGARLYRTGDIVRHVGDGALEFLGRADEQVKIRGFRIELGEVEAALLGHEGVKEAVVVASAGDVEEARLVAYLVAAHEPAPTTSELRGYLREKLPEHMIPSAFVSIEELPLTPNGKVDRRALPAPDTERPQLEQAYVGPRNAVEEMVAGIWMSVLKVERAGIHDNFFELGGDSIRAAVFINQLQERLGEVIHIVVIFDRPTIAGLAEYLEQRYAGALARVCGVDGRGAERAVESESVVDAAKVEEMRRLIEGARKRRAETSREKNRGAIFILSPPRSGSTLLRVMLGGHRRLFAPPELELLGYDTMAERAAVLSGRNQFRREGLARAVMELLGCDGAEAGARLDEMAARGWTTAQCYAQMQEWLGAERVLVDKTPSYALDAGALGRAEEEFEGARYIHLVRHPVAMVKSFEEARLDEVFFDYKHSYEARELAELVWVVSQENILEFLRGVDEERQARVVFEELVREPERELRRLCERLGLEYEARMSEPYRDGAGRMTDGVHRESRMLGDVKYHSHDRVDEGAAERWREQAGGARRMGDVTWRVAQALGYPRDDEENGVKTAAGRQNLTTIEPISSVAGAERILANIDHLSDDEVNSLLSNALAGREFNE
ncbi:MAG: amino acid adenylation domain-containing protein, partial [Pyrinomonadaceae bacterium]